MSQMQLVTLSIHFLSASEFVTKYKIQKSVLITKHPKSHLQTSKYLHIFFYLFIQRQLIY